MVERLGAQPSALVANEAPPVGVGAPVSDGIA